MMDIRIEEDEFYNDEEKMINELHHRNLDRQMYSYIMFEMDYRRLNRDEFFNYGVNKERNDKECR